MTEHAKEPSDSESSSADDVWSGYADPLGRDGDPELIGQLPEVSSQPLRDLRQAVDADDIARATLIVREGWFDLLLGDRTALLQTVESIPPRAIRESPLLAMLTGLSYYWIPHRRATALRLFLSSTTVARLDGRRVNTVDRAVILTAASTAFRLIGRAQNGVPLARMALRILHELPEEQRPTAAMLPRLYGQLGMTLYVGGHVSAALDAYEAGLSEVPTTGYRHGFNNLAMLAGIHAFRGDLPEAREFVALARDSSWTDVVRSAYPGTYYRLAEALLAVEVFDGPAAREQLGAMIHDRRTIEHWTAIATVEAVAELVDRHPGMALARVDAFVALRRAEGRSGRARHALAPVRALAYLALGNPEAARAILHHDGGRGPGSIIARARIELVLGQQGSALQYLRSVSAQRLTPRELAEFRSIEAAALLRMPSQTRSRASIDHLGSIIDRTGQRLPLTFLPNQDYLKVIAALSDAGYGAPLRGMPESSYLPDPRSTLRLTTRELAVLRGLIRAQSAAEIAAESFVSINTVKTQIKGVYRKLGVSNRDQAVAVALNQRLVDDPSDSK